MDPYIIAGPNGVGKTTFATNFLPKYANCQNFINADLIARGIAPFSPQTAMVRAGRLMLSEIKLFARRRVSFAFETTLSGRGHLRLIRQLKKQDYRVHFFFLWVDTLDIAVARVKERVLKGGHDVPQTVMRRRFERSMKNFFGPYRALANSWYLFDNTGTTPELIAIQTRRRLRIMKKDTYRTLTGRYENK
jgi:predicted ABC-type ATPase